MNTNPRSGVLAFILSFCLPGVGHLYMQRPIRGSLYTGGFFGLALLIFILAVGHGGRDAESFALLLTFIAALIWIANVIDMVVFLVGKPAPPYPYHPGMMPRQEQTYWNDDPYVRAWQQREKSKIIMMSFIPGLGHYQLGLMQRGLTAMLSFFGGATLVVFLAVITNNFGFMAFIFILPVIFFYSMFDALKQLERKHAGLDPIDQSLFEDMYHNDIYSRKNRTLASIIAVFPGAAHLYLAMPKRGLQLMAIFLFSIYVFDVLRLSLFFFLIPLLWFYSFFDALQQMTRYENGTLTDKPIIENWTLYQRPIGVVLLLIGCYYMINEGAAPFFDRLFPNSDYNYWFTQFAQTAIVAVILIGAGVRLLMNQKSKNNEDKKNP